MRKSFPSKHKALSLAIMLAATSLPVAAQQSDDDDIDIEEVVVTGSYIRGTPLDAPSPVQVIDRDSIEAQGAAIIWDVIKNLEINSGSITNAMVAGENPGEYSQVEGTANVNLRNLGENSTLTLINGKRMAPAGSNTKVGGEFVDINSIPLVMTERIEVLTDGGSALYGADAVAGVVNIIMRTEFEGFEISGDIQGLDQSGGRNLNDTTIGAIWGWSSDDGDTHFVLSAEHFERDPVPITMGNFYDENSEFLGTVGSSGALISSPAFGAQVSPGWINTDVMEQNVREGGLGTTVHTDPGCYTFETHDGSPMVFSSKRATRGERGGTCREDTTEYMYISGEAERDSFAASFSHTFDNGTEFSVFSHYSDMTTVRSDDGYNATRGPTVFLAQPGAYARNPYYGWNSIGQTLELGWFAPYVGLSRPTAADIPNAPVAGANGGPNTALWTSVRDGLPRKGGRNNETWTNSSSVQASLRGDFEFGDRTLNYDVSYSFSQSSLEASYLSYARDRAEMAANGLGGPNCVPNGSGTFDFTAVPGPYGGAIPQAWDFYAPGLIQTFFPGYVFTTRESMSFGLTSNNQGQGDCMFYNPFISSLDGSGQANSRELMDWMNERINRTDKRNRLGVFDAVVSGELMEMAGGTAQFAVGAQYRDRNTLSHAADQNYPGLPSRILSWGADGEPDAYHYVSNNYECAMCAFNYDHSRDTKAVFAELSLPFAENVETQLALRYEDYGGFIGSELSPKAAISWRPMETLLVRGSWSQSFRAPNIALIEQGLEAGWVGFREPIKNQKVRAGLLPATDANSVSGGSYTLGGPAPYVGNEYADTYSAGFIWTPDGALDGLSVQADFWRFEVEDRVLPEPPIRALQPEIDAFNVAVQDKSNFIYNDSIPADQTLYPTPYYQCDPDALTAQYGVDSDERLNCVVNPQAYYAEGIQRAFGTQNAALITLTLRAINAGMIESDGVDVRLGYAWDNDLGNFRVGLDYTHVRQYKLIDVPGLERGLLDTNLYDSAGTTGDNNLVRSLPDNKGHLTFAWSRDRQSLVAINRHIGSYYNLRYPLSYETASDFSRNLLRREISSYNSWDLQYNYIHDWGNAAFGSTRFSFGVLDFFNATLPYYEETALNYDASVFDGRGRRWYVRALWQL